MLSSARYGLPPPPVPRIQAPMARLSISSKVTGLIGRASSEPREFLEPHEAGDAQHEHQRHADGKGGHRRRGGVEGVLEIGEELDGQRRQLRAGEEQRQGEVVERDRGGEHGPRDHVGVAHAQPDLEERAPRLGSQALRRLLEGQVEVGERGGDGADHVGGGHHDVPDEERRVRGLHPQERVELEQRPPGEDLGQQERRGHEGVQEIAPAKAPAHQHDGRRRSDHGGGQGRPEGQLGGQPQGLHELAALEEVGEPSEREALGREREVVARVERRQHHHDHRQQQEGVDEGDGGAEEYTIPRSARSVTLMYTAISATEIASRTKALAAPKGQSNTESTCSYTTIGSTCTLNPPTRIGTTKELMASEKTSSDPARMPGSESGRVTSKKARRGEAPRVCEASISWGSMRFSTPVSERTMNGRKTCTRARVTPNLLYMSGSGFVIQPYCASVALIRP